MKTIIFLISSLVGFSLYAQPQDVSVVFHKPAKHFTESLPIGNGRLGAMLFGKTMKFHFGQEEHKMLMILMLIYI